jgi:hypothetical protein
VLGRRQSCNSGSNLTSAKETAVGSAGIVEAVASAASIMGASLLKRRRDSRSSGRGLGLLGFLIAATAARLGGNLVYEHRVGVDRAAEKPLPDDFKVIIEEVELEDGKPKCVEVDGTPTNNLNLPIREAASVAVQEIPLGAVYRATRPSSSGQFCTMTIGKSSLFSTIKKRRLSGATSSR